MLLTLLGNQHPFNPSIKCLSYEIKATKFTVLSAKNSQILRLANIRDKSSWEDKMFLLRIQKQTLTEKADFFRFSF